MRYVEKLFGDGGDFCCMPFSSAHRWGGFEKGGALCGESDYHHFVNASGLVSFHHGLDALIIRISGFKASIHKTDDESFVVNYNKGANTYRGIVRKTGSLPAPTSDGEFTAKICFMKSQTNWIVFDAREEGVIATEGNSDVLHLKLPIGRVQLCEADVIALPQVRNRELSRLRFFAV